MVSEWLGADPGRCGWSAERDRERPRCWEAFLGSLRADPPEHGVAKLQVTGPLTLAAALEGRAGGSGVARSDVGLVREVAAWVAASAASQVRALAELGVDALVVVDEPSLEALVPPVAVTTAAWGPLRAATPTWGLHVCCDVPWPLVEEAGPAVVSFDATLPGALSRAAKPLARLLRRGTRVAWGVLSPGGEGGTAKGAAALADGLAGLSARGVHAEQALAPSLVTGGCGTGVATLDRELVLAPALAAVAAAARSRAGAEGASPVEVAR